jgi:regulator of protease activity HflC (stomatin/prohibitin superfamily)
MKNLKVIIGIICIASFTSCTISPTAKQYAIESDAFNGEMQIHEGPGVKDYINVFDDVSYYDKVDSYSFSANKDEGGEAIEIRFANNGRASLSGSTDYRYPTGENKGLMLDIEENYGSPTAVESQLIRQALEKSVFTAGQFMNVFDALSKNRSYLQELIFDQANYGQYKVRFKEEKQIDLATGKEVVVKVSDRIECDGTNPLCVNGYLRTEESALKLYGIQLFNPTIKGLTGEASIEAAIASNLQRSNKMEELAIQAREAQVDAATTIETSKAEVAIEEAKAAKLIATAKAETAVKAELVKQAELDAQAKLAIKRAEAEGDKLKNIAGLSPLERATINKETAIGVAAELAKRPVPYIINNGGSTGSSLEQSHSYDQMLVLIKEMSQMNADQK